LTIEPPARAPALRGDQLGRTEELPAGVVDEQVQSPGALQRLADKPARVVGLADVADQRVNVAARDAGNLLGRLGEHVLAAPGDRHGCAATRELQRRRLAQSRAAARHQRRLPAKQSALEDRRIAAHCARS
jgi:hypothetical protein